jgi:hypothetical protein
VILLLWLASLPCLFWTEGPASAPTLKAAGIERVCVPPAQVADFRKAGLAAVPLSEAELELRQTLPVPGIRARADRASPTRSPWVNTNGWRLRREPGGEFTYEVPAGKGPLAAAEAYVYGADAVLRIDPADVEGVGRVLSFAATRPPVDLPDVADIGVVDDGGAAVGEVMNLLTRRNLLYRIVAAADPRLAVNVTLGTPEYPAVEAADPSAVALKIRRQLGDERRTLRVFGSEVVIGRLVSDGARTRLHLINYGGRDLEGVRVRLRGTYPEGAAFVAGHGRLALEERGVVDGGTEFTIPRLGVYGAVDLSAGNFPAPLRRSMRQPSGVGRKTAASVSRMPAR